MFCGPVHQDSGISEERAHNLALGLAVVVIWEVHISVAFVTQTHDVRYSLLVLHDGLGFRV